MLKTTTTKTMLQIYYEFHRGWSVGLPMSSSAEFNNDDRVYFPQLFLIYLCSHLHQDLHTSDIFLLSEFSLSLGSKLAKYSHLAFPAYDLFRILCLNRSTATLLTSFIEYYQLLEEVHNKSRYCPKINSLNSQFYFVGYFNTYSFQRQYNM